VKALAARTTVRLAVQLNRLIGPTLADRRRQSDSLMSATAGARSILFVETRARESRDAPAKVVGGDDADHRLRLGSPSAPPRMP
jgi:hypothetical protein